MWIDTFHKVNLDPLTASAWARNDYPSVAPVSLDHKDASSESRRHLVPRLHCKYFRIVGLRSRSVLPLVYSCFRHWALGRGLESRPPRGSSRQIISNNGFESPRPNKVGSEQKHPGSGRTLLVRTRVWSNRCNTSVLVRSLPMKPVSRFRNSVTAEAATAVVNEITAGARSANSGI
jgi:hypothetical protein